ncbi:MAG: YihY/virulence factor BrkB family protein [Acidobacteriota bacterium]|nr:YihY/virulence factor BrkB family protein [Acidobacteriota bacterium]
MPRRRPKPKDLLDLWIGLFREHDLMTYATAIAFQALVALVAVALLALAVLGEIGRGDVWTNQIGPRIEPKVLPEVFSGMTAVVEKIFHTSSVGLIVLASIIALFELSLVVRTASRAIARIYGQTEDRSWSSRWMTALGISAAITAAVLGAILLATAARTAVHGGWSVPFTAARWLLAAVLITAGFGVLLRFGPPRPRPTRWASAGGGLVVLGWIAQTLVFAEYLGLTNYRSAALSLLGVYFLTSYLLVAAIVLLVGVELNELIRRDSVSRPR